MSKFTSNPGPAGPAASHRPEAGRGQERNCHGRLEGRFPAPAPFGERATRWVEHEVDRWMRSVAPPDSGVAAPVREAVVHRAATV